MEKKTIVTLIVGIGSYIVGQITTLTLVFALLMILDYLTGTLGSIREEKEFSKKIVRDGIIKKGGYIIFWILAVFMDIIILDAGPKIGLVLDKPITALIVTCWLIGTEGSSILSNLQRMGVINIPGVIGRFFSGLKNIDPEETDKEDKKE